MWISKVVQTHPTNIKSNISCSPLSFNSNTNSDVVAKEEGYGTVFAEGRTRQTAKAVQSYLKKDSSRTHIRLDFHDPGKGRGYTMTPTPASPSSRARRCASLAPTSVIWMATPFWASTSFFRPMSVAMMSALSTLTTSGRLPCNKIHLQK